MGILMFILSAALTCYAAAMFQSAALMAIFLAQVMIIMVMLITLRFIKNQMTLCLAPQKKTARKNIPITCGVCAINKSRLPVGRFRARIITTYPQTGDMWSNKLFGSIGGKCEDTPEFNLTASCCGLAALRLENIHVYDCLSIFSAGLKTASERNVAILPVERALTIRLLSPVWHERTYAPASAVPLPGDDQTELRQLRKYRQTDSHRHIHWNRSALTGILWTKEYEAEQDVTVDVFLDLYAPRPLDLQRLDAFYEVTSALLHGLLAVRCSIILHRYGGEKAGYTQALIQAPSDVQEALFQLYAVHLPSVPLSDGYYDALITRCAAALRLSTEPALYFNADMLHRFSAADFMQEIDSAEITI